MTKILATIQSNPKWSTAAAAMIAVNATYLLPDQSGPGTLFLPVNTAFQALSEPIYSHVALSCAQ